MTRMPPSSRSRSVRGRLLAALAVVALVGFGVAAGPIAATASPTTAITGDIVGSVADPASFVTGDSVFLYEFQPGGSFSQTISTTIASDGSFTFTAASLDTTFSYAVYVDTTAVGYVGTYSNGTMIVPDDGSSPGVLPGAVTMDFGAITMAVSTVVDGEITPADSSLDGTTVSLIEYSSSGFGQDVGDGIVSTTVFGGSTITAFFFNAGIHPGQNYVLLLDPTTSTSTGYTEGFATGSVTPPDVGGAGTLDGAAGSMDFGIVTVPTLHTLSGTVISNGNPVVGAEVDVSLVGYPILGTFTGGITDGSGHYQTDPLFPIPSGFPVLLSVGIASPSSYVTQFYSGAGAVGAATQVVTSGVAGSDLPGYDFDLIPIAQRINILAEVYLPGCGCGSVNTHLYVKTGAYWTPVETQNDLESTAASFIESNPGDYRLRFTDDSGNWMAVDPSNLNDSGVGGYAYAPAADDCAIDISGTSLGDQPNLSIDLVTPTTPCGDEPAPPAPVSPVVRHSLFRTSTEVTPTPDVTPTPTPIATVTPSPTPEPTVTTQTPSHPATPASANLAWIWWLVGILVLVLVLAGLGVFFFRRRV
ncbi:MAG: hypothetical protein JWN80_2000 [Microbacteriaceae bacterium]|nr:hypothetical protein [Microbacteriaceae bacterium]